MDPLVFCPETLTGQQGSRGDHRAWEVRGAEGWRLESEAKVGGFPVGTEGGGAPEKGLGSP